LDFFMSGWLFMLNQIKIILFIIFLDDFNKLKGNIKVIKNQGK